MGVSECDSHRESSQQQKSSKSNNDHHRGTELRRMGTSGTDTVLRRGNTFDSDNAEDFIN